MSLNDAQLHVQEYEKLAPQRRRVKIPSIIPIAERSVQLGESSELETASLSRWREPASDFETQSTVFQEPEKASMLFLRALLIRTRMPQALLLSFPLPHPLSPLRSTWLCPFVPANGRHALWPSPVSQHGRRTWPLLRHCHISQSLAGFTFLLSLRRTARYLDIGANRRSTSRRTV